MSVTHYLSDHWGIVVLVFAMSIVLYSDIHLERRKVRRIAITNIMVLIYSVSCYVEGWLGEQTTFSPLRAVLSAVDYSLVTFILLSVILVMYPMQKGWLYIPALLNCGLCFLSIPTGVVFYFSSDNHFGRGTLGYLTYFINALYLIYLVYSLFSNKKSEKEDYLLLGFLSLISVLCLFMPMFMGDEAKHWFDLTIAIDIMLYYVYLLQQLTKRDSLTELLNRQSYYTDARKYMDEITAVVTMDMDGLKDINDTEGHVAGDKALKTLADCFWKAAKHEHRVYRIGGDEYVILCMDCTEEDVKILIERIRTLVAETEYSCSLGYAMRTEGSTIDTLYNEADTMLYEDKKQFYIRSGKMIRKHSSLFPHN